MILFNRKGHNECAKFAKNYGLNFNHKIDNQYRGFINKLPKSLCVLWI
jgi:hypothetical protein